MRAGVRVLSHPQGVRLDGHLLRGGAASTVYHCTSPPFVLGNRTRCVDRVQERPVAIRRPPAGSASAAGPASSSTARSSVGSLPAGSGSGRVTTTSGVSPTSWIQRLSGVSQRAIVSLNAPPSPLSSCHCWTVPLPNDCWPTSVARSAVLERPGDDLAGRCAAAVDEDDDLEVGGGRDAIAERVGRDLVALRVLLPEDRPRRDELAGDLARGGDVAARVAAQVEDELRPAGGEMLLERLDDLVRRDIREARQPDVADRPAGQRLAVDLLASGRCRG